MTIVPVCSFCGAPVRLLHDGDQLIEWDPWLGCWVAHDKYGNFLCSASCEQSDRGELEAGEVRWEHVKKQEDNTQNGPDEFDWDTITGKTESVK